jgi:hypothetical protein
MGWRRSSKRCQQDSAGWASRSTELETASIELGGRRISVNSQELQCTSLFVRMSVCGTYAIFLLRYVYNFYQILGSVNSVSKY